METLSVRVPQKSRPGTDKPDDVVISVDGDAVLIRETANLTDPLAHPVLRISKYEFKQAFRALFPEPAAVLTGDWWKTRYPWSYTNTPTPDYKVS